MHINCSCGCRLCHIYDDVFVFLCFVFSCNSIQLSAYKFAFHQIKYNKRQLETGNWQQPDGNICGLSSEFIRWLWLWPAGDSRTNDFCANEVNLNFDVPQPAKFMAPTPTYTRAQHTHTYMHTSWLKLCLGARGVYATSQHSPNA